MILFLATRLASAWEDIYAEHHVAKRTGERSGLLYMRGGTQEEFRIALCEADVQGLRPSKVVELTHTYLRPIDGRYLDMRDIALLRVKP